MRVIARKVHKNKYYYLQHSYRKNGKVFTKEKYLGLRIPMDLTKDAKILRSDAMNEIYHKLELIKGGWRSNWNDLSKTQRKSMLNYQVVNFVYNVLGFENKALTKKDVEKILIKKYAPPRQLDIINKADALGALVQRILVSKEKISVDNIESWYYEIFHDAGQFLSVKMSTLLKKILSFIRRSSLHPIEIAALVLFRFEKLHPYERGNEIISHILMDLILIQRRYPPMDFSLSDKARFIKAMKKGEDQFVSYVIRKYTSTYAKYSK